MTSEQQPIAHQATLWVEEDDLITKQRMQYHLTQDSAKTAADKLRRRKKEVLSEARAKDGALQELADQAKQARKELKELEIEALEADPEYLALKQPADELKEREKEQRTKLESREEQSKLEAAHIIRAIAG